MFAVTPAKNRDLLKSSADSRRIRQGKCGNARRRREGVEGKERKSKKRFVASQRGRASSYEITSLPRAALSFFLFSSNLTLSSFRHRQMADSIEEIPKETRLESRG